MKNYGENYLPEFGVGQWQGKNANKFKQIESKIKAVHRAPSVQEIKRDEERRKMKLDINKQRVRFSHNDLIVN